MAKKKLSYGSKKIFINVKKIRDEFARIGIIPGKGLIKGALTEMLEDTANELVNELNKRSSMRATQGTGSSYFTRTNINRAVVDKPFENARVNLTSKTQSVSLSLTAPLTSTKGNTIDLIDLLQTGRPRKQMPEGKRIIFPVTQKGAERLIKKRIGSVTSVKSIFRAGKARYKKRNGKLVLVSLGYLPAMSGRDILGVIARDMENRISKQKIEIPDLGITGNIGKGLVKVKVDK